MTTTPTSKHIDNLQTVIAYVAARKRAEEFLGFLTHLTAIAERNPEDAQFVCALAEVCVPFLATGIDISVGRISARTFAQGNNQQDIQIALDTTAAIARAGDSVQVMSAENNWADSAEGETAVLRQVQISSLLVVPVGFRRCHTGRICAVRAVEHRKGPFGAADIAIFSEIAHRVATILAATPSTAHPTKD
jgi:GAF domain-containing protein